MFRLFIFAVLLFFFSFLGFGDFVQRGEAIHAAALQLRFRCFGGLFLFAVLFPDQIIDIGKTSAFAELSLIQSEAFQHGLRSCVGFRVNGGIIERFLAAGNADKAGALSEGFLSKFRHFLQLLTVGEHTIFFPVGNDVFGDAHIDAGDVRQQRR